MCLYNVHTTQRLWLRLGVGWNILRRFPIWKHTIIPCPPDMGLIHSYDLANEWLCYHICTPTKIIQNNIYHHLVSKNASWLPIWNSKFVVIPYSPVTIVDISPTSLLMIIHGQKWRHMKPPLTTYIANRCKWIWMCLMKI